MKNFFIIAILTSLWGNSVNSKDCLKFHEGKFRNTDKISGTTYITREDSIQTEINNDIGFSMKFRITWISDCRYTLEPLEVLENKLNIPMDSSLVLTVDIIEIKRKSYKQRTTSNKYDLVYESEIFLVKDK